MKKSTLIKLVNNRIFQLLIVIIIVSLIIIYIFLIQPHTAGSVGACTEVEVYPNYTTCLQNTPP